jgi:hypothetical protein
MSIHAVLLVVAKAYWKWYQQKHIIACHGWQPGLPDGIFSFYIKYQFGYLYFVGIGIKILVYLGFSFGIGIL